MTDDAATPLRALPQEYIAEFPLSHLEEYPGNPKDHDLGVLDESLSTNGWYGAIVAQRRGYKGPKSKGKARVLVGHGRRTALRAKGVSHAPVLLIDCDDDTARRIVLVDNESSRKGGYNAPALLEFLRPLAELGAEALRGTAFDLDDTDNLAALLQPPEWSALPSAASEPDAPYKATGEVVLVRIAEAAHTPAVREAVIALLREHPEWSASVDGASAAPPAK